jgi:parvulin-like peptidyl-prolyl isomerase
MDVHNRTPTSDRPGFAGRWRDAGPLVLLVALISAAVCGCFLPGRFGARAVENGRGSAATASLSDSPSAAPPAYSPRPAAVPPTASTNVAYAETYAENRETAPGGAGFRQAGFTPPPENYYPPPGVGGAGDPEATQPTFELARIVARVGSDVILAGDVLGPINQALEPYEDKMTPEQLDQQRELLVKQHLPSVVEMKMLYLAYLRRNVPANKMAEALPQIWQKVHEKFDEEELPKLLEKYKVETPAQLDAALRKYGWSLSKQRRFYGERALGMAGAFQSIPTKPEVTHDEMLRYFDEHGKDYEFPAQARWEQLSVRFDRFPTRAAAYEALARMGDEVALGGAPLAAVAQRGSQSFNAQQGGQHDWTTKGSLASEPLNQAIFQLPLNELSPIIEDGTGLHIVRVLERREAGRTPFTEAQIEIRKKLQDEKRNAAYKEYIEELRRDTPVWTIYDRPAGSVAERPSRQFEP